ncbi:hypothetical protein PIB30_064028 [Stylosanthes scabra]|uniref:Uncharacterized protein n=1 Tax=Stylosanthes scabra TaxID=79078 RepID=A0ABU6TLC2_9FABA|nr:hypothetical protein [Stylosanthes scabra]
MTCALFSAELVSQFNTFLLRNNVEPTVMVVQMFKSNFYLEETSIQSIFHSSQILLNLNYPEVKQFRERYGFRVFWVPQDS